MALKFLKDVDVPDKQRHDIMAMCETFHTDVRNLAADFLRETGRTYYLTPTSYLELITMFTNLLGIKRSETEAAKRRYNVGLEKLEFTAGQVKVMQNELTALKPDLEKTVVETDALMARVQKEKVRLLRSRDAAAPSLSHTSHGQHAPAAPGAWSAVGCWLVHQLWAAR